jgi:hypothetical protein
MHSLGSHNHFENSQMSHTTGSISRNFPHNNLADAPTTIVAIVKLRRVGRLTIPFVRGNFGRTRAMLYLWTLFTTRRALFVNGLCLYPADEAGVGGKESSIVYAVTRRILIFFKVLTECSLECSQECVNDKRNGNLYHACTLRERREDN